MLKKTLAILLILTGLALAGIQVWQWYVNYQSQQGRTQQEVISRDIKLEPKRRSIVLITTDTTRADHLQPYGALNTRTPVLQELANKGILFKNATAVAPITLPAHTSINTGLYQYQHGVHNNGTQFVPAKVTTLAERLKSEGYQTAAFVSAEVLSKTYGLNQGFDLYDDDLSTSASRFPRMVPDRPGNFTVDSAIQWLQQSDPAKPFFIWVHFYDPHAAYNPPPPYRQEYSDRPYDGEIAFMDEQIGRLLATPRIADTEDLLINVIGDHGESFGEHGERTHAILAYQATLHVPWIMQIKGGPAGLVVNPTVSQVDFVPTVLGLLGLPADPQLLGMDLFAPGSIDKLASRTVYAESYLPYYSYGWAKLHVARQNNWKYIDAPKPELYDLIRDPHELTNLIEQNTNQAFDLETALADITSGFTEPTGNKLQLDSDAMERLRGLGYIAMGNVTSIADDQRPDPKDMIAFHVGLERARALANDGLLEEAESVLDGVLETDPNNISALVDLTQVYIRMNELDKAGDVLSRAMELDPEYRRLQVMMAGIENRRGEHEKARALLASVLDQEPRENEARLSLVTTLLSLKRTEEAKALLAEGLKLSPDSPKFNLTWANMVELPVDEAAAEKRIRAAIARDPFLSLGWLRLGDLQVNQGKPTEAIVTYRQGLAKTPDDPVLHGRLGVLLAQNEPDSPAIEKHLLEAIRLTDQPQTEYHLALGAWYGRKGQTDLAQKQYDIAIKASPKNPAVINNQAIALYQSGKVQEALDSLKALVKKYPQFSDGHNNLAALAVDQQQWALAETEASKAVKLNPGLFEAWSNLAIANDAQNKTRAAAQAYQKTLEIKPDYWPARVNYGLFLHKQGKDEQAKTELAKVLSSNPTSADTHYALAEIADQNDAWPVAKKHYNLFLKYAPNDPRGQAVRQKLVNGQ